MTADGRIRRHRHARRRGAATSTALRVCAVLRRGAEEREDAACRTVLAPVSPPSVRRALQRDFALYVGGGVALTVPAALAELSLVAAAVRRSHRPEE
ncbi:hypothetical protein ABZ318_17780 [Streptomyces sp. NPDC006197]|uniref:hypothetical protein n=1 Tax=Streptomyces sp. NPDC006197 TaxID=3156685 RepID=UPI0033B3A7EA